MKKHFLTTVALVLSACGASLAAPPPPPTGNPGCWPPPCVPVDNGIIALIAAGLIYGAYMLYRHRRHPAAN